MKYVLPPLPYAYDALEPYIDKKTMQVHHDEHHKSYVEKLNKALEAHPDFQYPLEELLATIPNLPVEIACEVKNQGGGHANHTLFWTLLTPKFTDLQPCAFTNLLNSTYGGLDNFKKQFTETATKHFGSGWAWLCTDLKGKLHLFSTKDHESPITQGMLPLLVLDLWEHAYYLKYQNKRPEFIQAFWNIVNWPEVAARFEDFRIKGGTTREWRIAS